MFNNVALDVFIGIVFVFLLYSLLATILQEMIAGLFNLRAAVLVKAIRVMLNDREPLDIQSKNPLIKVLIRLGNSLKNQWNFIMCNLPDKSLAKAFYKHPSIKYLSASSIRSKPSYINPTNFSATIIKILRGRYFDGSVPEIIAIYQKLNVVAENQLPIVNVGLSDVVIAQIKPETLDQLRQLCVDAHQDIDKFKALLEGWFNDTMDRANGWYTRQTKRILFIIGFLIAFAGNVDTLKIYQILATNETAREQMVQLAIESQSKYKNNVDKNSSEPNDPKLDSTYAMVEKDVNKASSILGIGKITKQDSIDYKNLILSKRNIGHQIDALKQHNAPNNELDPLRKQLKDLNKQFLRKVEEMNFKDVNSLSLVGWIITAFALTLGAPFWFDLLNKFISLRSAGAKPTDSDSNTKPDNKNTSATSMQPLSVIVNSNTTEEAVG